MEKKNKGNIEVQVRNRIEEWKIKAMNTSKNVWLDACFENETTFYVPTEQMEVMNKKL